MKILKEREERTAVEYYHNFVWKDTPSAGFVFHCKKDGALLDSTKQEKLNAMMQNAELDYEGVKQQEYSWKDPAVGVCNNCGSTVILGSTWVNTCDGCGVEYNSVGQELAPRSEWGAETGEQF